MAQVSHRSRLKKLLNLTLVLTCSGALSCGDMDKLSTTSTPHMLEGGLETQAKAYTTYFRSNTTGKFVAADELPGQPLVANRETPLQWETFQILDRNGGDLESGDVVFIQSAAGYLWMASDGGGGSLSASSSGTENWEMFRLVRSAGPGKVKDNDEISIQATSRNKWVSIDNSNSGVLHARADHNNEGGRFKIQLVDRPWKLVWNDEFKTGQIDSSKWSYEVQRPGWVNNEKQNYTNGRPENARIENEKLVIEARRDWYQGHEYSSARLKTQGKASWTYGPVEARIKISSGRGTWPAFWMMPENQSRGWPACGEIDILEHVGHDPDTVHATTHSAAHNWTRPEQRTASRKVPTATDEFHLYSLEWHPDRIEMYVDGYKYFTSPNDQKGDDSWPFNKNFHLILNLAVGGNWGGAKGVDPNIWPQKMLVDWVRIYKRQE